jgi:single-strand DNA-binding protein
MSFNKVLLIGNVGRDPEVRHLEGGSAVANFTLATSERFKDKNGATQDITEWHNIVCWRNLAELSEKYIRKGSQIFVEGKIRTRNWTDQQGVKHYSTEVVADEAYFVDAKGENGGFGDAPAFQTPQAPKFEEVSGDDDLPF